MVKVVPDDSQFLVELGNAGSKLVVVDFTASWCGPCQRIAPFFAEMAVKYSRAVFLKVDVDQCQETASSQGVTAMPTFIFYRNKIKIGSLTGANTAALEDKIKQFLEGEGEGSNSESDCGVPGHMDLISFIHKGECECLNESDEHCLNHCLQSGDGYLESDCDEQLIISLTFNQPVKLHSMKLTGPAGKSPKTIKLFINQPRTLDFDQADSMEPVQLLQLQPNDVKGNLILLKYVKLQYVQNLQLFIKDNQDNSETTQIDYLSFIGSPICSTNMGEFKRIAGKKGESH